MKHRSFLMGLGRAALLVLLALSTALLSALLAVRLTFYNRDLFTAVARESAYLEAVETSAAKNIESECLFYGIEYDCVKDCLNTETVKQLSEVYLGNLYDALHSGEAIQELPLSAEIFAPGVDRFFDSLGEYGEAIDAATRLEITQALASTAKAALQPFPYSDKLPQVYTYTFGHPLLAHLDTTLLITGLLFLGSLAAALFWSAKDKLTALYRSAGVLWCAGALWFIPFSLFVGADLPAQLAFDGTLKVLVTSLLNAILSRMEWIFGITFGVFTLLLIVTAVILLCRHNKKAKQAIQ